MGGEGDRSRKGYRCRREVWRTDQAKQRYSFFEDGRRKAEKLVYDSSASANRTAIYQLNLSADFKTCEVKPNMNLTSFQGHCAGLER
jgi:hypothetical protein